MGSGRYPDNGSVSASQWFNDRFAFVQGKAPGVNWQMPFATECMGLNDIVVGTPVGTGVVENSQTRSGGWWRFASGATGGSFCVGSQAYATTSPAVPARIVSNARTKPWATAVRVVVVSLPGGTGATDDMLICNLLDLTNDTGLQLKGSVSQTNWVFNVGGSFHNTGVAAVTGTALDLCVINDTTAGTPTVTAYLNGVAIDSAASSGIASAAGYLRWFARNLAAANNEFQLDKVMGMTELVTT